LRHSSAAFEAVKMKSGLWLYTRIQQPKPAPSILKVVGTGEIFINLPPPWPEKLLPFLRKFLALKNAFGGLKTR
jgi:hypothetical protein